MADDKRFELPRGMAKYSGRPDDNLRVWTLNVTYELDACTDWTARQRLRAATRLLEGPARSWFFENHDAAVKKKPGYTEITSWLQLQERLKQQFQPELRQVSVRRKLDDIKQGKQSVQEYATRFRDLVEQLPDTDEGNKVHRFACGLRNPRVADEIGYRMASTLDEAVRIAQLHEQSQYSRYTSSPAPRLSAPQHQPPDDPMELDQLEQRTYSTHPVVCHACGERNHIARHCTASGRRLPLAADQRPGRRGDHPDRRQSTRPRPSRPRQYRAIDEEATYDGSDDYSDSDHDDAASQGKGDDQ